MRWQDSSDDALLEMLDDLELQAEGLHLADRAVEVDELSVAQYAEVELAARLHASAGATIRVGMLGGLELHGRLAGVGADWILVDDGRGTAWFASTAQVAVLGGLLPRSVPTVARPLSARLSLRSVLRRLADGRRFETLHLCDGRTLHGSVVRVGADFVELRQGEEGRPVTVPLTTIAVVQTSGDGGVGA